MDYSSPTPAASAGGSVDMARELRVVRLALGVTLVALVILTGSLGVYLFRQVSILRRQNEAASRTAAQALQHYKANIEAPAMQFERNLQEFARTNADFQARIAKYFQAPAAPQGSNAPAPGPAPAAPAAR